MTTPLTIQARWLFATVLTTLTSCSVKPDVPLASTQNLLNTSSMLSTGHLGSGLSLSNAVDSAAGRNPFTSAYMFVNPVYSERVRASAKATALSQLQVENLAQTSTALWLDSIAAVAKLQPYLDLARASAKHQDRSVSVTLVVYDLPERDCNANASNGELTLDQDGLNKYRGYIDQIASITANYPDLQIAAIVEPDSLPNIVTNLGNPKCAKAKVGYEVGIAYAIAKLAASNVAIYLDSAHGGWLGWPDNRQRMAQEVRSVLDAAGGVDLIRGFSINVANYNPLNVNLNQVGSWYDRSNPAKDELTFARLMAQEYANVGISHHAFVIDTGRSGVVNSRKVWGYWCNVRGAGIGERPKAAPADGIDAYLWIKPPGESDGTSDPKSARYDSFCGNEDAAVNAPDAGEWFETQFAALVSRASPGL